MNSSYDEIHAAKIYVALMSAARAAGVSPPLARHRVNAAVLAKTGINILALIDQDGDAAAKDLIQPDSVKAFLNLWSAGGIDYAPFIPCDTLDLEKAYRAWCAIHTREPVPLPQFLARAGALDQIQKCAPRVYALRNYHGRQHQQKMLIPCGALPSPGKTRAQWLTDCRFDFKAALAAASQLTQGERGR